MSLTEKQLKGFLALAEERHFTRAADRCNQTQPAFSALIRSLEDALGVRLFDRTTRRVELTAEGRRLAGSARRLLNDMDAMVQDIHDHVAKRKGSVSVAALPSLAAGWLPDLYARFHREHPGVKLALHDALLDPCLDMVRSGTADIAVAAKGRDMSGLTAEPLCEDHFYLICRRDHPLARRCMEAERGSDAPASIGIEALAEFPIIQLGRNSSIRQSLAGHPRFVDLQSFLEVDHLATVTGLVVAGLGVSLVPAMTLFQFQHEALCRIRLSEPTPLKRSLYLIRRSERSLSVAAQAFHDLLLSERKRLPQPDD